MDDFDCKGDIISKTLKELDVINKWLGGYAVTGEGFRRLVNGKSFVELTVADIGCGGGDTLIRIKRWADEMGIKVKLIGIDANTNIIAEAADNMKDIGNKKLIHGNIFNTDLSRYNPDIINCTLLIHHFTDEELIDFLRKASGNASLGIIVNDLHRHWFAFHSIRILTRIFSGSSMVINDAPLSVLRAFKRKELEAILRLAGLNDYSLRWRWAFRWQLVIRTGNNPKSDAGNHKSDITISNATHAKKKS